MLLLYIVCQEMWICLTFPNVRMHKYYTYSAAKHLKESIEWNDFVSTIKCVWNKLQTVGSCHQMCVCVRTLYIDLCLRTFAIHHMLRSNIATQYAWHVFCVTFWFYLAGVDTQEHGNHAKKMQFVSNSTRYVCISLRRRRNCLFKIHVFICHRDDTH